MEGRSRLSRGSVDVQTSQWQPMVGTPTLVPEPRTVIFNGKAIPVYWEPALESCDVESRSLITLILAEFNND